MTVPVLPPKMAGSPGTQSVLIVPCSFVQLVKEGSLLQVPSPPSPPGWVGALFVPFQYSGPPLPNAGIVEPANRAPRQIEAANRESRKRTGGVR